MFANCRTNHARGHMANAADARKYPAVIAGARDGSAALTTRPINGPTINGTRYSQYARSDCARLRRCFARKKPGLIGPNAGVKRRAAFRASAWTTGYVAPAACS